MAERTEISWADATFNPWIGCTKVSPGCDNCYAEALDRRWGGTHWGVGALRRRTSPENWAKPLAWDRKAKRLGRPLRVFCASLADIFDNEVPQQWRTDLWQLIEATPNLRWLLLTKRIGNAPAMLPMYVLPNVWLGITVVDQAEADRDIPKLAAMNAPVRWLSIEPQLAPIDLSRWLGFGIHWVITGGESGPRARPFVLGWAKEIVRQCRAANVAVHVKQLGANPRNREGLPHPQDDRDGRDPSEWPLELRVREFPAICPAKEADRG